MRLVKYILTFIIFLVIGFTLFMPKSNIYYKVEDILQKQGIVIDNEEIQDNLLDLKILHPVIYYQGLDVARASIITFRPMLVLNTLKVEDIELLGVAKNLNIDINRLSATHSILKPFYIKLNANGSFGLAKGYVDLKNRLIHIDIVEPKNINPIRNFLKKGEKGWYYESNF